MTVPQESVLIQKAEDRIFALLFQKDEITWQSVIHGLVKTEEMNPWDIDVSLLANKYIETIKKLHSFDFHISGKMLLAAAILLNIKSTRLLGSDMHAFDALLNPEEIQDSDEGDLSEQINLARISTDKITLIPRTPQPRKRKVSIFDLVDALQKALEVKRRRILRDIPLPEVLIPERKIDIDKLINDLHEKITSLLLKEKKLTFATLVPSERKEDKIYTFIPLLHLSNQRKVDLEQKEHFGDIEILPL